MDKFVAWYYNLHNIKTINLGIFSDKGRTVIRMGKGSSIKRLLMLLILLGLCLPVLNAGKINYLGQVTISPAMPKNGERIYIKAELASIEAQINDVIIIGGIDSEPLFRKSLNRIPQEGIDSVQFFWTSRGGKHTAWFRLSRASDIADTDKSIDFVETIFIVPGGVDSIPWTALPEPTSLTHGDIQDGLLDEVRAELPDLVLPDPPDRYLIAYNGEKISVPITVKNLSVGNAPASSLEVRCNEKGITSTQQLNVPSLDQGEQVVLHFDYIPKSEWDILCDVSVDPDMAVQELNENNNSNRFTLQVWSKSLPDLIPSLRYSLISPGKLRWSITVQNIGEKESEPAEYLMTLACKNDSGIIKQPEIPKVLPMIPALAPKESYLFNSSGRVEGNQCTFTIKVDVLNKLQESNEGNNTAEITIRLK